jgi:hypothetical protein
MKTIGEVQPVGGAHFVEGSSLLSFLDAMYHAALKSRKMQEAGA